MLMCPEIFSSAYQMKAPFKSFQFFLLNRTRVISILVNLNEGKSKENLYFQNAVSLQLLGTAR
jgi:hypothetical protein